MKVHPKPKRAKIGGCHEEGCGGGEDWELGIQRNDKRQSPNIESKEIYSIYSDKPHENELKKRIYIFLCV